MLKRFFGELFVQGYRALFVAVFMVINFTGAAFLGITSYFLFF